MGLFTPWMSKNSATAENAVKQLTDQKKLVEAALKAPLEDTRAAAVVKLTDQAVIAKIAATDASVYVRMKAISVCVQYRVVDVTEPEKYGEPDLDSVVGKYCPDTES